MSELTGYLPEPKGFSTKAIHSGTDPDRWDSMCIVPPIVMASTFKQHSLTHLQKYQYGRSKNPSRDVLEESLAALEDAKHAICYASGVGAMAAIMSVFEHGVHFVSSSDIYGGTFRLFDKMSNNYGVEITQVDASNIDNFQRAIKPNTKLIFIESPTNPLFKVIDIKAVAEVAKRNNVLLCVDNTFLTPFFQRPLDLGADFCMYSLTKYMNGHSDVVMGAIVTNSDELNEKFKFLQKSLGSVPSPFDCSLVTRSLKTLSLRMGQHFSNSVAVAKFLESHPKVLKVLHPGLESHEQHELTKRQTSGHSGALSIYIDGDFTDTENFLKRLKIFTLAESLGGYESLAALPSKMSHASVPEEIRKQLNITDNLVRLSVGLEDPEDLLSDLKQALDSL